ncbi:isochorismatase family protein [Leptospira sp. 96542]|nr:isochorismatase family protein [Leptospira sp. 96542]
MKESQAILFTQCLQNDFTSLLDKFDPLPNALHVGYTEANRLLGEMIEEGPVFSLMDWAYETDESLLKLIHIRDWHDPNAKSQQDHLIQFGSHCLQNSRGAEFVFQTWVDKNPNRATIINASGLNDFVDTNLDEILKPLSDKNIKVGLTGVWTEAKVSFLAYDLKTRYPNFEIGVCSALTASSSLSMHFIALDQLKQILGVKIFSSIGAFTEFLTGEQPNIVKKTITHSRVTSDKLKLDENFPISDVDKKILLYLFRDCKEAEFKTLDGGFSGNVVLKSKSTDHLGHSQVPCVVKIGNRDLIAKERMSFERIQEVLGNNAPSIVDFCELETRGAIKYRYAAMLDGNVRTFQKIYTNADTFEDLDKIIDIVFGDQLGRLYEASTLEKCNLLEYYDFQPKYSKGVRSRIESLLGNEVENSEIEIIPNYSVSNPIDFYEKELLELKEYNSVAHNMSYVHGDLNGANIIIDAQENVWMIDFFHTQKGHILRDLIKLENDILYIFCKIESENEWKEAILLTDFLHGWEDLGTLLPYTTPSFLQNPKLQKAYRVIAKLRSYYPKFVKLDRDPYQLHVAALRYAMHTLAFDESNDWQKKWALFAGSKLISKIKIYIQKTKSLRIDFLKPNKDENLSQNIGLTILPGRKDRSRVLANDLKDMKDQNISHVLSLITEAEYTEYGVTNLKKELDNYGFISKHCPILDQRVPSFEQLTNILQWLDEALINNAKVLIHCVGGLGRSGTIAAAYLIWKYKLDASAAIQSVRESRSERAIESKEQVQFLKTCEEKFKS